MINTRDFENKLKERVLVLDGAMGTTIQRLNLDESDFRGERFRSHNQRLFGCNDLLCLTKPKDIKKIHAAYICAGVDIISTNTFNANAVSMADYGLDKYNGIIYELNKTGAELAKTAVIESGRKVFVAGSIGPTNRSASISPDIENPAYRNITYDELFETYSDQIRGLIDGNVDILLFETVFDTLNLKAGLDAANSVMWERGISIPIMISATLSDKSGRTLSGQTLKAFVTSIEGYDNVVSVGLNCSFGGKEMIPHIRELGNITTHFVSAHPNAGLPNALGEYQETPDIFASMMVPAVEEGLLNIVGGCCGTTPDHIAYLVKSIKNGKPHKRAEIKKELRVSGLEVVEVIHENNFVNVGERCNVAGSRKFLRLIKEGKYEEALQIAVKQVEDGAMLIDINMDDPLLDAEKEMVTFLRLVASDPEVAKVPIMVDTSNWNVAEAALKNLQGKSIVNSISLKEGKEEFIKKGKRIRQLGAAVIVMAFDELGQADTYQCKIEICNRSYNLLTKECGMPPEDIIFDVNIMAVATGLEEHDRYGLDFIRAVKWIKENLPGTHTSGGVSNLSFAFRGKNHLRECMHSVFLYHAIAAGMDMGIVNPATSVTYDEINESLRSLIEDVVLYRRAGASEDLSRYALTDARENLSGKIEKIRDISETVETRLVHAIIKGHNEYLIHDIEEALESGNNPVDIISGPLMEGMNKVGELFGEGKMFLPQVVKTARTMKTAVDYLRPFMEKDSLKSKDSSKAGTVLFATVKGDVHDIGKNITSIVLACNNYEVVDLGVMVPTEEIIKKIEELHPDLVCLSGLITPSLAEMVNVAKAMEKKGFDIPLIVGGATTSKLHTALKIAPVYHAPVIHALDASQNPLIASRLLDKENADSYRKTIYNEYRQLCDSHYGSDKQILPIEEARAKGYVREYVPVAPRVPLAEALIVDLDLKEISRLINWKMFFHAWKLSGSYIDTFPYDGCEVCKSEWRINIQNAERDKGEEALRLYDDARSLLASIISSGKFDGKGIVAFYPAGSFDDNIVIGNELIPALRQQSENSDFLSLADFIMPSDYIGLFAVSAGNWLAEEAKKRHQINDSYKALLLQTLSDRIAEAASEWLHRKVRTEMWGYSDEDNNVNRIMRGEYQGIRPAIGYPILPDQLLNYSLDKLLPLERIGLTLTENGAMYPSSSISGLYISNPNSHYFMVGKIGEDQLKDYAERRSISVMRMKEILRM
ncbi:MAG: methionine synthase [Bacteroides sp.]|nr:methionine synthase [Bacteroides sp.]